MPKDPPRNQPNYKIGGYHINEYEYTHNKGAITREETQFPRSNEPREIDGQSDDAAPTGDAKADNSTEVPDVPVDSPS